jgi:asparagine synthase (glutamine-hydrolysing)
MSAIWGVWHRDGRPRAALDTRGMLRRLSEYGRDRQTQWSGGAAIGLGAALTCTLPEDNHDRQPLTSLASGAVLVASLRLDNRAELAHKLGIPEAALAAMADAAVLLAAWDRWDVDLVQHLIGDFAFAVWDPRHRRLFAARDPFGGRALHYFEKGPLFAFATAPKGLHVLPEAPRALNAPMIAGRLALLPETGDSCFFEGIRRLPSGHTLSVTQSDLRVARYWSFDTGKRVALANDGEYVEAFRELLDEAVRCRLRARGPVGSMLSGGLDSSTVTATAALLLRRRGKTLNAYTGVPTPGFDGWTPPDRFGDEGPHAATVAAMHPNVSHRLVAPAPLCPLDAMPEIRQWTETPGGHFCMSPARKAMAATLAADGVTTVLTGAGGNLTISYDGIHLLPALLRQGRCLRWLREARALAATRYLHRWRSIAIVSFGPFAPMPLWKMLLRERPGKVMNPISATSMIHPRVLASGELDALSNATGWDLSGRPASDGRRLRASAIRRYDLGGGGAVGCAPDGVDYRDPTADRRLVEFLLAIPEEQFLRNGETKSLLRRAMAGRISETVLRERRKGLVGADWYLRVAPYRDRFARVLEDFRESPVLRHYLDLDRMGRLVDRWPDDNWDSPRVATEYRAGFCRAIAAGGFIRWVERGN